MSDQGGAENLWEKSLKGGAPKQVTQFHDGRLLWPSISYDGKTIVFERDFRHLEAGYRYGQSGADRDHAPRRCRHAGGQSPLADQPVPRPGAGA